MKIFGTEVGGTCLGTMYFGTKVPENNARRVMDAFAAMGGVVFDSANKYASWIEGFSGGESEALIGRWLKGKPRDRFVLTSKVGFAYGAVAKGLTRAQIISECEKSLRRFGTDYIDLYFAHTQDELTPIEESLAAFDELIRAGKIRAAGASNYDAWRLAQAASATQRHGLPGYTCLQQRYSLIQPVLGADLGTQKVLTPEHIDFCRHSQVAMMAYSPLLGGLYEQAKAELPAAYDARINRDRLVLLHEFAHRTGFSPTQLVLAWLRAADILPVVATGNACHLADNMRSLPSDLTAEFTDKLRNLNRFDTKY